MREAYSRLSVLLHDEGLTLAELAVRLRAGDGVPEGATLVQLSDPDRPLAVLDLRVAEAICNALAIEVGDLIAFLEPLRPQFRRLSDVEQHRLDTLLDRHSEAELRGAELAELERLVAQVEENDIYNAQRLAEHRRQLRAARAARQSDAAD